jgi:hypothetical protein
LFNPLSYLTKEERGNMKRVETMTGLDSFREGLFEILSSGQRRRHLIRRLNAALPRGRNRWFISKRAAQHAAQRTAQRLGHRMNRDIQVNHHIYQPLGLRHYHLSDSGGRTLRLRFIYMELTPEMEAEADTLAGGHGGKYQSERQHFLRQLLNDPNQPRFIRGWIQQELRRIQQAQLQKPGSPRSPSQREQRLRSMINDAATPDHARQWAQRELNRLKRGQKRPLTAKPRKLRLRGIPGFDVGHRIPGKHDRANFRVEHAATNRARPGIARRGNIKRWRESE